MAFATQSTVAFGDTWSATQHNVMINNDIYINAAFHVPLFPISSGIAPSSGLTAAALSQVQSSGAGTIKPEFWILACSTSTDTGRIFQGRVPRGYGSSITIAGAFYMASASSGNVVLGAQIAALSDADTSVDAKVFAADNTSTVACPTASKKLKTFTITMTNADSVAAGDWFNIAFRRAPGGSDNATGNLNLVLLDMYFSLQ